MKVFAILGGLGSQMCKYALLLAVRAETGEKCAIDTSYFLQRKSWNGYELKKLFSIDELDFAEELDENTRKRIIEKKTDYLTGVLRFIERNYRPLDYYFLGYKTRFSNNIINKVNRLIKHKYLMFCLGRGKEYIYSNEDLVNSHHAYYDEYRINSDKLYVKHKDVIKKVYVFPELIEGRDIEIKNKMLNENSVALHIRRTDHLGDNGALYAIGYYKKAVEYIRNEEMGELTYYIFSDDITWCKNNLSVLGLSDNDCITFVDWHSGKNSYIDMQLMTFCKHNVLAISSFSWWGYYLSDRKNKIVCAPEGYWIEVANHF